MSNDFGKWFYDAYKLPAFEYTLNQYEYTEKYPMSSRIFNKEKDHYAQIGNDRIIGIPSNYGYIRIRQDEGSPKYINDYDADHNEYAGGFGYLTYGDTVLSTYYHPGSTMKRIFGASYFQKIIENEEMKIDQVIYAPFGDDPIMKDDVKITNKTDHPINITYYEYYGNAFHQFIARGYYTYFIGEDIGFGFDESNTMVDPVEIVEKDKTAEILPLRREFDKNYEKTYVVEDDTMFCKRVFAGYNYPENIDDYNKIFPPTFENQTTEDLNPPITFLASLHEYQNSYIFNTKQFFSNNVEKPYGLNAELTDNPTGYIIKTMATIEPNQTITLQYLYGYTEKKENIKQYKGTYRNYSLEDSLKQLSRNNITCEMKESWMARETLWNSMYLRQSLTYDSYFGEHILSQGAYYQYIMGFQGAVRDPLQHCLPFLFTESKYTKEVIRYTLKQVLPDGTVPYGVTGFGKEYSGGFTASDQELYIIWVVCEYVLGTKDYNFLREIMEPVYLMDKRKTVLEYMEDCLLHFINEIGLGEHGLVRMCTGDWSDSILRENIPEETREAAVKSAESGFNTAMCIYTMEILAELMHHVNPTLEKKALDFKENQMQRISEWWNGKWFPRFIHGDVIIGGDEELWLEPQTWLLIGKVLSDIEANKLIHNIEEYCIKTSPIGAKKRHRFFEEEYRLRHTDGVWWAINGLLIWGLQKYNPKLALLEWKKNSLHYHENEYPYIWYGIWSGPDNYESVSSKYPGVARYNPAVLEANEENRVSKGSSFNDFPVNILHPHAWSLYSLIKLTGIEFTYDGLSLENIPSEEMNIDSPLYTYHYDGKKIKVTYKPEFKDVNHITLRNIPFKRIFVNDKKVNPNNIWISSSATLTIEL